MNPGRRLEQRLVAERALAIVRSSDLGAARRLAHAALDAGWRLTEISLTTPSATTLISELAARGGAVGAGTVRHVADATAARDAGAEFLVSPGIPDDVDEILSLGLPLLPGVMTPTDVLRAARSGISCVKLFPANLLSTAAIAAYREPFPDMRFVAVGGVRGDNARDWLDAGAIAVGVSSGLRPSGDESDDAALLRHLTSVREAVS